MSEQIRFLMKERTKRNKKKRRYYVISSNDSDTSEWRQHRLDRDQTQGMYIVTMYCKNNNLNYNNQINSIDSDQVSRYPFTICALMAVYRPLELRVHKK